MIVTFCGHSNFYNAKECEQPLLDFLESAVGDQPAQFYLGSHGDFDRFALHCGRLYQKKHPNVSLILITPYPHDARLKYWKEDYDEIIYPEIEDKPLRFAISYRNRWMVEKADRVVVFVRNSYGGAYQTYLHAKRRKKLIFNLAELIGEVHLV